VAGAGNVIMAAGLRATAKAVDHPPEPNVGAPVLDPTVGSCSQRRFTTNGMAAAAQQSRRDEGIADAATEMTLRAPR
jgi:hypothetical protein